MAMRRQKPSKPLKWRISHMRDWREARDLTQEKMVELLEGVGIKINRVSYSRYESGNQIPSIKTLEAVAKILKIDLDTMLNYTPAKHRERLLALMQDALS